MDLMVRRWPHGNGLLGEAMEEQSAGMGAPAIEAEGEFVEVVVEVPVLDTTAQQAARHFPRFAHPCRATP
jgi:hypothetical protein